MVAVFVFCSSTHFKRPSRQINIGLFSLLPSGKMRNGKCNQILLLLMSLLLLFLLLIIVNKFVIIFAKRQKNLSIFYCTYRKFNERRHGDKSPPKIFSSLQIWLDFWNFAWNQRWMYCVQCSSYNMYFVYIFCLLLRTQPKCSQWWNTLNHKALCVCVCVCARATWNKHTGTCLTFTDPIANFWWFIKLCTLFNVFMAWIRYFTCLYEEVLNARGTFPLASYNSKLVAHFSVL